MGGVVKSIDPGRGPVSAGRDPEIAAVEAEEEEEEAASATGGGREIVNDPVDSEPCHFYCMSARKCCSLTKQVHNDIFFKDGLLNKKFVVIQYSLCNLFLVGGIFLTVIPLS